MPDSFPPLTWGPPFDERNLDALLSGRLADPPSALRQVADALTALRAAPASAELTGEAAARAEFRAAAGSLTFGRDEAARTDGQPYAELLSALALDGAGRPPARHRSIRGARGGPGRSARPHRARPPGRRLSRRGGVLLAATGAAFVVAAIALAVSLPGPIHSLGHSSAAGKPSATHPSVSPGSQNVQAGSAARDPSHKATPSQSASVTPSATSSSSAQTEANSLCHAFYLYFVQPWPHEWSPAEATAYLKIAKLAGYPPRFDVNSYCGPYVQIMFPQGLPRIPAFLPGLLPGAQDEPGNGQQGPGNGGPGPGMTNGTPVNN